MMGSMLFDLMMTADAMAFSPSELSEHIEASVEKAMIGSEDDPDWYAPAAQQLLVETYDQMCKFAWPHVTETEEAKATAVFQRMNSLIMEFRIMRLAEPT